MSSGSRKLPVNMKAELPNPSVYYAHSDAKACDVPSVHNGKEPAGYDYHEDSQERHGNSSHSRGRDSRPTLRHSERRFPNPPPRPGKHDRTRLAKDSELIGKSVSDMLAKEKGQSDAFRDLAAREAENSVNHQLALQQLVDDAEKQAAKEADVNRHVRLANSMIRNINFEVVSHYASWWKLFVGVALCSISLFSFFLILFATRLAGHRNLSARPLSTLVPLSLLLSGIWWVLGLVLTAWWFCFDRARPIWTSRTRFHSLFRSEVDGADQAFAFITDVRADQFVQADLLHKDPLLFWVVVETPVRRCGLHVWTRRRRLLVSGEMLAYLLSPHVLMSDTEADALARVTNLAVRYGTVNLSRFMNIGDCNPYVDTRLLAMSYWRTSHVRQAELRRHL